MKKFCINCGKEISDEHKVCIYCGAKQPEKKQKTQSVSKGNKQDRQDTKQGKPATTKKKPVKRKPANNKNILIAIGVIVVVFLVHMGLKSYYSLESVEERFDKALKEENTRTVKKLVNHENGEEVKDVEVEALFELMSSDEQVKPPYGIQEEGTKFFFYPNYKVYYRDQYAWYGNKFDGLEMTFNGEDFLAGDNENSTNYGPFLPGIYQVELEYDGEMGEISEEFDVLIFDDYEGVVDLGDVVEISRVSFRVNNYHDSLEDKIYIAINDQEIKVDEYGETAEVGPIFLGAKPTFEVVSDLPWGEIHSDPIEIEEDQIFVNAQFVDDEQYEVIIEKILDFSEEYLQALANKNTESLTDVSDSVKEQVIDYIKKDYNYMGRVDKVQFNRDDISVRKDEKSGELSLRVPSVFHISESVYSDDIPVLDDYNFGMDMVFTYTDKSEWLIQDFERNSYASMEATKTLEGSKELYTSEEGAEAKSQEEKEKTENQILDEASYTVERFITELANAVNYGDYHLISSYINSNSSFYDEQSKFVADLYDRGISEKLNSFEIIDMTLNKDQSVTVKTRENFRIYNSETDKEHESNYQANYILKEIDGQYLIDQLEVQ